MLSLACFSLIPHVDCKPMMVYLQDWSKDLILQRIPCIYEVCLGTAGDVVLI